MGMSAGALSMGEIQRLQLARVLHQCPIIVVIDEGTSAMDATSEQTALDCLSKAGIAVLVTAQLQSRLRQAFNTCIHL